MKWLRSLAQKKVRQAEGVFVAEGPRLVSELLGVMDCRYVAATQEWSERMAGRPVRVDDVVTVEELGRISGLEAPQQVVAVFAQPQWELDVCECCRGRLTLLLDEVQNPGNLGTIVRLADWFGVADVFCTHGCAEVWNPKVVQASMGGLARVRVHRVETEAFFAQLPAEVPVYGTFLDGDDVYGLRLEEQGVIVMGNEGNGISAEVQRHVTRRVRVPSWSAAGHVESLNVAIATAVVCAEFRRQGGRGDRLVPAR